MPKVKLSDLPQDLRGYIISRGGYTSHVIIHDGQTAWPRQNLARIPINNKIISVLQSLEDRGATLDNSLLKREYWQ